MTNYHNMTDREIVDLMQEDTPINRVRKVFNGEAARMEQAQSQSRPVSSVNWRRMEFEAAEKLIAAMKDTK